MNVTSKTKTIHDKLTVVEEILKSTEYFYRTLKSSGGLKRSSKTSEKSRTVLRKKPQVIFVLELQSKNLSQRTESWLNVFPAAV